MNSDEQLLTRLRTGEKQAVEELYQLTFRYCASHITNNSGTAADAREIFQEVLIVLFKKLQDPAFRIERSLKSYLYVITKNLWSNHLRQEKKTGLQLSLDQEDQVEKQGLDTQQDAKALEEKQEKEQLLTRLEQLLKQHSADCRKLLRLFFYERKKSPEVAVIMGYKESYVRKKKKNCIDHLRKQFGQF
ncbi:MAG: sigma-70 family RNA polymerase sigma factor [Bacteroidota bacterium]